MFDDVVAVCIPACDPLAPNLCPSGHGCFQSSYSFECQEFADTRMVFETCAGQFQCATGLYCGGTSVECGESSTCCHQLCDLNLPNPCAGVGQICQPFFNGGSVLPEYKKLGLCTLA